jgi:hypothetical protein
MTKLTTLKTLSTQLINPTNITLVVSFGIHGLLAVSFPALSNLAQGDEDQTPKTVRLVTLSEQDQARLPNLSATANSAIQNPLALLNTPLSSQNPLFPSQRLNSGLGIPLPNPSFPQPVTPSFPRLTPGQTYPVTPSRSRYTYSSGFNPSISGTLPPPPNNPLVVTPRPNMPTFGNNYPVNNPSLEIPAPTNRPIPDNPADLLPTPTNQPSQKPSEPQISIVPTYSPNLFPTPNPNFAPLPNSTTVITDPSNNNENNSGGYSAPLGTVAMGERNGTAYYYTVAIDAQGKVTDIKGLNNPTCDRQARQNIRNYNFANQAGWYTITYYCTSSSSSDSSPSPTPTPTNSSSPSPTPTATPKPSASPSPTPTATPTNSSSPSPSPTPTATPTNSSSPSPSPTPTPTNSSSPSPTPTTEDDN